MQEIVNVQRENAVTFIKLNKASGVYDHRWGHSLFKTMMNNFINHILYIIIMILS